jgi:hypothetical protein
MDTCTACKKPFKDGDSIIIITDATIFNDGEVEHGDTERYHSTCVTVDW